MRLSSFVFAGFLTLGALWAAEDAAAPEPTFRLEAGTKIPLSMLNSISSKNAADGDRIYLETIFPVMADGRIIIPVGSSVAGTVTRVNRPGRAKGRGELYVRFDSIILPNGVMRDFRARVGALDGRATEQLDRTEGKIRSDSGKTEDAIKIGSTTAAGASAGSLVGIATKTPGMGAGIGAAAGAAAGLAAVMLTRGPDAMLAKGTTLDMVLDRPLIFSKDEVDFSGAPSRRAASNNDGPAPKKSGTLPRTPGSPF